MRWGVVRGVLVFTPILLSHGEGHIVNTASLAGLLSGVGQAVYAVSKHGVVALSETLHRERTSEEQEKKATTKFVMSCARPKTHENACDRSGSLSRMSLSIFSRVEIPPFGKGGSGGILRWIRSDKSPSIPLFQRGKSESLLSPGENRQPRMGEGWG